MKHPLQVGMCGWLPASTTAHLVDGMCLCAHRGRTAPHGIFDTPAVPALLRLFATAAGTAYTEAPVNRWAQLAKARDAADVELFEAVVDRMNARQARRDAAAAAAAAGQEDPADDDAALLSLEGGSGAAAAALAAAAEGWDEGSDDEDEFEDEEALDEMYGEGFTEFMQGQDGVVFYEDGEEGEEADEGQEEARQQ
jgi:hypothetical protein